MNRNRFKRLLILATCLLPVVLTCNVRDTPVTPKAKEHIGALHLWLKSCEFGTHSERSDSTKLHLNASFNQVQISLVEEGLCADGEYPAHTVESRLWPGFGPYQEEYMGLSIFWSADPISCMFDDLCKLPLKLLAPVLPYLPPAYFAERFFQPASWQFLFFQPVIIGTLVYVFWEKIKIRQISRLDGNNHTDRY